MASPLALRQRNHKIYCVQCQTVEDLPDRKLLRCSRCKLVSYCSQTYQVEHFVSHRRACKIIARVTTQASNDPSVYCQLGEFQFLEAYCCCNSIEQAALGHEDPAIAETEHAMMRWSIGDRNNTVDRYNDVMKMGMQKQRV